MKTELLVSISKKGLLGTNEEAFKHLIMASGRIKLAKKYLEFENKKYVYSLGTYNANNVDVINYHFSFWTDEDKMEIESEATLLYSKLQDYIECVLRQHSHHIEILWDDLSYECAQKAYPLIYTVENKMRFLITKFMLVNVGTKWEKENMPLQIKNSNSVKRNEKNSDKFGIVYALDFIELSDVLFKEYSFKENIKELDGKDNIMSSDLEPYIPKSNWERYFSSLIANESDSIKSKWNKLYDFRCTIAHNRRIKYNEYLAIKAMFDDINPILSSAIDKLSSINMPEEDKEAIAENIASIKNEKIGRFIVEFRKLEEIVYVLDDKKTNNIRNLKMMGHHLQDEGLINKDDYMLLNRIIHFRIAIIHGNSSIDIDDDKIDEIISDIIQIRNKIEEKRGNNDTK